MEIDASFAQIRIRRRPVHWSTTGITSERLSIRPFAPSDADEAYGCITPTLTRYLSFDPAPSKAVFETIWRGWLPKIEAGVDLPFAIRHRETCKLIGLAGLHRTGHAEPELGIWVREDLQAQGYGREAVRAIASWAAASFKPHSFIYPVAKQNTPSRRLAEALGGIVVAERRATKYGSVVYRIPAAVKRRRSTWKGVPEWPRNPIRKWSNSKRLCCAASSRRPTGNTPVSTRLKRSPLVDADSKLPATRPNQALSASSRSPERRHYLS
jgi:RimJ/RimL family protein N-acetyltransferase